MADTAQVLDILHKAKNMVTDAVEKVNDEEVDDDHLKYILLVGETSDSGEITRLDQTNPSCQNSC